MTTRHPINSICPRCHVTQLVHVHCANRGCTKHVTVCERCDPAQAVTAYMQDHAKDCLPWEQPAASTGSVAA